MVSLLKTLLLSIAVKIKNKSDSRTFAVIIIIFEPYGFSLKDADGMANSVDPDLNYVLSQSARGKSSFVCKPEVHPKCFNGKKTF